MTAKKALMPRPSRARRKPVCRLHAATSPVGWRLMARKTINAAVYSTHGNPAEVLRVESQPWPQCGPGEAIVEVRAAPINPADLNQIEGKYPVRASLPARPGFEGTGARMKGGARVTNSEGS